MNSSITSSITLPSNCSYTSCEDGVNDESDSFASAKSRRSIISLVSSKGTYPSAASCRGDHESMATIELLSLDGDSDDYSNYSNGCSTSDELLSFDSALQVSQASLIRPNDMGRYDVLSSFPFSALPKPLMCPINLQNVDVQSSSGFLSAHKDSDCDSQDKQTSLSLSRALYRDLNKLSISKNHSRRNLAHFSQGSDKTFTTYSLLGNSASSLSECPSGDLDSRRKEKKQLMGQESPATPITVTDNSTTVPPFPYNLSLAASTSEELTIPCTVNVAHHTRRMEKQHISSNLLIVSKALVLNQSASDSVVSSKSFTTAPSKDQHPDNGSLSSHSTARPSNEVKSPSMNISSHASFSTTPSVGSQSDQSFYSTRVNEIKLRLRALEVKNGNLKYHRSSLSSAQTFSSSDTESASISSKSSLSFNSEESAIV